MKRLTYSQQDGLEHLYTLMGFADLLDSTQKAAKCTNPPTKKDAISEALINQIEKESKQ